MDFCIISPTAGLERYAALSKTHLVLAKAYNNDHQCRSFYNARREAKDFIILDNGAYEGRTFELTPHDYPNLRPDVVVLPDYLFQPWQKTWHAAIAHLDKWYDRSPNCEWCYIPQAEKGDLHGFIESYQEAVSDPRILWIGIPRALCLGITDNPLARVEFARMVRKEHERIKLHCFGMVNGDIHELPYLAHAGVTSIDSSAPVWRGWGGLYIDRSGSRNLWDAVGTPVDFNAKIETQNINAEEVIQHNLEACNVRIPDRVRTTTGG